MKYPNEFLGRCSTCLDNALLDSEPCPIGYGNGMPLNDDQCAVRRAQKEYREEQSREDLDRATQISYPRNGVGG